MSGIKPIEAGAVPPDGIYEGLRAITVQSYSEANVKNGSEFESSMFFDGVSGGAATDVLFVTGSKPVSIKARQFSFNGSGVNALVYKNSVYTGGTPVDVFNLTDISPNAKTVTVLTGATVTDVGDAQGATTYYIGTTSPGASATGAFSIAGVERILAPNTVYLLRLVSTDAQAQDMSLYWNWYEGELDLPLP